MSKHISHRHLSINTENLSGKGNRSDVCVSIPSGAIKVMPSIKLLLLWVAVGANFSTSPGVCFNKSWWTDLWSDSSGDCLQGSADFFSNQPLTPALRFQLQHRTRRSLGANRKKKNLQNSDTDLCFSLLTLHRTERLWHPVLSPSQPDYKLAVYINSLKAFPKETKQEAHKRDEVCAAQVQSETPLLIKITRGTNQQLKFIVFIVPRIKKLSWQANELKTFWQTRREKLPGNKLIFP